MELGRVRAGAPYERVRYSDEPGAGGEPQVGVRAAE